MNKKHIAAIAVLTAFGMQATSALATCDKKFDWTPASLVPRNCEANGDFAVGAGKTLVAPVGSVKYQVTVNLLSQPPGSISSSATALNSSGIVLCSATDQTADGNLKSTTCTKPKSAANTPVKLRVLVD